MTPESVRTLHSSGRRPPLRLTRSRSTSCDEALCNGKADEHGNQREDDGRRYSKMVVHEQLDADDSQQCSKGPSCSVKILDCAEHRGPAAQRNCREYVG